MSTDREDGDDQRFSAQVPGRPVNRRRSRTARWLLLVPVLGLAAPSLYNRQEPAILGIPFFYAYQLLMIALAAGCMVAAYLADRADRRP